MHSEFYKSIGRSNWNHRCSVVANVVNSYGVVCFGYIAAYRWNGFDRRWIEINGCLFCFSYPFGGIVHNGYRKQIMTRRHISTAAIAHSKIAVSSMVIGET